MDDLLDDDRPGRNEPEYTVSELSGEVKRALEGRFGRIRVRGEIGRIFRARSGHLYYDVKDDRNVLACTTWKGQIAQLSVQPEEGLEVVVTGRLSAFGAQSKYNLNVDDMAVAGQGALMAMLERRRAQLAAEGLFEEGRKRPLPFLPDVIGVVTSPQGAVIRDILHRLRDRFPRHVLIWPVAVQGKSSASEVAAAIRGFDALAPGGPIRRPDLVIVARGGGSIEDLWGFNEEIVVRAASDCTIPLISAVGHETDTTLIDHVADWRAPTPTAAAERAVPVRVDLTAHIDALGARQERATRSRTGRARQRLADLARALPRPGALLEGPAARLDRASDRLPTALRQRTAQARLNLRHFDTALAPEALRVRLVQARGRLDAVERRLHEAARRRAERRRTDLEGLRLPAPVRLFREPRTRFATLAGRLDPASLSRRSRVEAARLSAALSRLSSLARSRQERLGDRLMALDRLRLSLGYRETLSRGYAIVRAGEAVVVTASEARQASGLTVEFADGKIEAQPRAQPAQRKPREKGVGREEPDQGTLF
ncbi:exodeoxyribonuclease VII large subunit [Jannaschia aquimarina]|uniref:Exodeoxyribonuclease 7 large subunit n=1 Tax=Jannaschia aquimarina TaxID=935700 RepID=A0A0D1EJB5_9RHOB|nr:exodeoxyribonuclease VII large subunit [Jannaschia aquimarina]KIT17704.1 Exodeoxyribonuclease 7 large subunit [Jannaschia aquimarina]SNS78619.1 Exodeoxyribonuclease VII large subunit [Jannaschia aquimarina]